MSVRRHSPGSGHVAVTKNGVQICATCKDPLESCRCQDDGQAKPYCTECRGTGWVIKGMQTETKMVVHVLNAGRPLCGFHAGVPAQWPRGHAWVSISDTVTLSKVNCSGCLALLSRKGAGA